MGQTGSPSPPTRVRNSQSRCWGEAGSPGTRRLGWKLGPSTDSAPRALASPLPPAPEAGKQQKDNSEVREKRMSLGPKREERVGG